MLRVFSFRGGTSVRTSKIEMAAAAARRGRTTKEQADRSGEHPEVHFVGS